VVITESIVFYGEKITAASSLLPIFKKLTFITLSMYFKNHTMKDVKTIN